MNVTSTLPLYFTAVEDLDDYLKLQANAMNSTLPHYKLEEVEVILL